MGVIRAGIVMTVLLGTVPFAPPMAGFGHSPQQAFASHVDPVRSRTRTHASATSNGVEEAHTDRTPLHKHVKGEVCEECEKLEARKLFELSGQIRLRPEAAHNQSLGDFTFQPGLDDEQLLERTRVHLKLRTLGDSPLGRQGQSPFRLNIELEPQWYAHWNKSDLSEPALYQAFIEPCNIAGSNISFKVGRQELNYGSTFFLGPNDFYQGMTFDAAKVNIAIDKFATDLIAGKLSDLLHQGNTKTALYGFYSTYQGVKDLDIDWYFFYRDINRSFPDEEKDRFIGIRAKGIAFGNFDYEVEPIYQFGKVGNANRFAYDDVQAYGGHVDLGYTFRESGAKRSLLEEDSPLWGQSLRVFFAYAYGSGDGNANDDKYKEFQGNVYNDNFLVGDMSVVGDLSGLTVNGQRASGIEIYTTGLNLELSSNVAANIDYHHFIGNETPQGISDKIGGEGNFILSYQPTDNLKMMLSASRFFTGDFFKDAAGSSKDMNYYYLQTELVF